MLTGTQAVSVGCAHLTVTSNKSVCSVCWWVQGFVRETVPAINVVQANGFVILAFLSHTSHIATGLYYSTCLGYYKLSDPSKPLIIDSSVAVVFKSFSSAFTKHNVEEGFNVKGMFPLSGYVFDVGELLLFFLTDICWNEMV
jgi:hypothetical protein